MGTTQHEKAETFRDLHHRGSLLILPNIWDRLSVALLAASGFPALATASVAVAQNNGYPDGERIPFERLTGVISEITSMVDLPLTVDLERGFAGTIPALRDNIKALLDAGAVGLNIEDSEGEGGAMTPLLDQCRKITAIRETAEAYGVPILINARTDVFLAGVTGDKVKLAIERGNAYSAAGADCFYPILVKDYHEISLIVQNVPLPVNALMIKPLSDLRRLEELGVARVSIGPALLRLVLGTMKAAVGQLQTYENDIFFEGEPLSKDFLSMLHWEQM